MKTFYIILFAQILVLSCNASFGQVHKPDSIKVEFEGFNTETVFDVTCEAFASTFTETKKVKVLCNQRDLSRFELLKKDFKQAKARSFDVRGTITYIYGKILNKYCFDLFGYFYKDGKLYSNKNLLIAISDKIYTNHPKYLDTLSYHE